MLLHVITSTIVIIIIVIIISFFTVDDRDTSLLINQHTGWLKRPWQATTTTRISLGSLSQLGSEQE